MGRIHSCSRRNSISIGITVVCIHELTVDVELQVILKQRRIEADTCCCTLEVRSLKNTVLVGVADADTIRHILRATLDSDIVVSTYSRTINLFLPVGICLTEKLPSIRALAIIVLYEVAILCSVKNINGFLLYRIRDIAGIRNLWFHSLATLLCCDDDNTIRTTRTINSCCRSILKNRERFNIVRVYHRKRIRKTLYALIVHSKTINDNKRIVRSVQ